MERYLFKIDKELLDLQAMEMDDALCTFFQQMNIAEDKFEMENDYGVKRKFSINWDEQLLQGRGIKGFFASYNSAYLWISLTADHRIMVSAQEDIATIDELHNQNHAQTVLQNLAHFNNHDNAWFQLYKSAEKFQLNPNDNQLLCLPYLREMETFDYQIKTVKSVLSRFKGRVMFSDEVGLGKTVEAGMAMLEYIMRGLARKILILVPPSLVQQWEQEMKRKFNQDFIRADDPAFKKMGDAAWGHYQKVIASIDTAKRKNHRSPISQEYYDLVIVDEAHHIKNRRTQKWQFVNAINKKYIFLLTATPVQNHLEELYNLITLLKPGQLNTYSYFRKHFVEGKEGIEAKNVDKLKSLLADVMIRNKRSNVDVTFTNRTAYTRTVTVSQPERTLYDNLSTFISNNYERQGNILNRFRLKNMQEQIGSNINTIIPSLEGLATNEKLSAFDRKAMQRFLDEARSIASDNTAGHKKAKEVASILQEFDGKMIVFTKFSATQQYLSNFLKNCGFKVAEFHGSLRRKEKEEQVTYFREEADVLVSTEVGGEGRNLQFCNGMINYDLPWNPMAIEQRIGRIHRIGQERDVFVYNLVAEETIEYYILDLLDRKINMFELVVGEVDAILGDMEEKEDFSEMIMKAWVEAEDTGDVEAELNEIGETMLQNKQKLIKRRNLDDTLF
ncbi:putative ATP-dependent helicase YqhH [Lentibacillus kapialis]|uniref:ATP-dependent helicase YqhH n=1 Tax=Lentibacillus kapialis TaxID=340214 RepID=A0A917UYK5_9BACI|nr:SNF2-related protein [Lentibacillus kapialis]GGJ97046.1 putative ATP-dependent helicase YqhH [Lentibacillus kapialis]